MSTVRTSSKLSRAFGFSTLGLALVGLPTCKCKPAVPPAPSAQKCALGTPPAPAMPKLFRALSSPPAGGRYRASAICTRTGSVSDECEVVDDMQAILGTGFDCENGADAQVGACEGWAALTAPTTSSGAPTCGSAACPNQLLDLRDPNGASVKVIFHDDPSCHQGPREPGCPKTKRDCYYRVLSVEPKKG